MCSDLKGCWGEAVTNYDRLLEISDFGAVKLQFEQFFKADKA
jgi:hypothetical protein